MAGQQLRDLALPDGVLATLILRSRLQPWIDRLFDPDPDEASLPVGPDAAARSLADLLATTEAGSEVQVGSFGLRAGADQDLVTACCLDEAPLRLGER